ncbi:vWA domain-containing protein [Rhodospirillum sp. A1_3_36]|uniref:vWA domain-containing protein n=1 Tax=Rhodospirillum sp. A1_3_36 TaxID=3391666 RepID=UPI0039A48C3A
MTPAGDRAAGQAGADKPTGDLSTRVGANILGSGEGGGRLAENVMHFARILREAGLPVGPGRVLEALEALDRAGIMNRRDFYWVLHSVFITKRDQREVFDQAFHMFWRNPDILERMMAMLLPTMRGEEGLAPDNGLLPRVAEALTKDRPPPPPEEEDETRDSEEVELDAALTMSPTEVLSTKDFERMTGAEFEQAKRVARTLVLPVDEMRTRRFRPDPAGDRPDPRATLRAMARRGGELERPRFRRARKIRPPLVVLCDISGSMERYARILLHFIVGLSEDRDRMHVFLFGTRLTNVTRPLRHKDPDLAVANVSKAAEDWSGGTRIAACLRSFNRDWSRRVLGQGAVVLLITDGLERDDPGELDAEVARLSRSCRSLMWLNPLLRYDAYAPKARGARALVRHVHAHCPVHNLASLADLARALGEGEASHRADMAAWRRKAEES